MVHFTQSGSCALFYSDIQVTESLPPGYPIRLSGNRRICAPPPGFSQLITAFFASQLLGIHHKPFLRLTILSLFLFQLSYAFLRLLFQISLGLYPLPQYFPSGTEKS